MYTESSYRINLEWPYYLGKQRVENQLWLSEILYQFYEQNSQTALLSFTNFSMASIIISIPVMPDFIFFFRNHARTTRCEMTKAGFIHRFVFNI